MSKEEIDEVAETECGLYFSSGMTCGGCREVPKILCLKCWAYEPDNDED